MESTLLKLKKSKTGFYDYVLDSQNTPISLDLEVSDYLKKKDPGLTWHYFHSPRPLTVDEEAMLDHILAPYPLRKSMSLKGQIGGMMMRDLILNDLVKSPDYDMIIDIMGQIEYKIKGKNVQTVSENVSEFCYEAGVYVNGFLLTSLNMASFMYEHVVKFPKSYEDIVKNLNFVVHHYNLEHIISDLTEIMYQRRELGWWYKGNVVMADLGNEVLTLAIDKKPIFSTELVYDAYSPQLECLFQYLTLDQAAKMCCVNKQSCKLYLQKLMGYKAMRLIDHDYRAVFIDKDMIDSDKGSPCVEHDKEQCVMCSVFSRPDIFDDRGHFRAMTRREAIFIDRIFTNYLNYDERRVFIASYSKFAVLGFSASLCLLFKSFLDCRDNDFATSKKKFYIKPRGIWVDSIACDKKKGRRNKMKMLSVQLTQKGFDVDKVIEKSLKLMMKGLIPSIIAVQSSRDSYVKRVRRLDKNAFRCQMDDWKERAVGGDFVVRDDVPEVSRSDDDEWEEYDEILYDQFINKE